MTPVTKQLISIPSLEQAEAKILGINNADAIDAFVFHHYPSECECGMCGNEWVIDLQDALNHAYRAGRNSVLIEMAQRDNN